VSTLDYLTSTLKQAGMRLTPQRIAICRLLSKSNYHPSAVSIFEEIRPQYPSLSLMTVYNTLKTLVDLGAVNSLGDAGDGNVHYDGNLSPHLNMACVSCHEIVDIASPVIANLAGEISSTSDFKVLGARLMYYGYCPNCQNAVE
jgi:Fur family transcriptional regulator, peroxide stress response regulator